MRILKRPLEAARLIRRIKREKTIGFVPTLGALHGGHLSLIRRAARETDFVVVSIFVNPLQFDRREDLRSYPRPAARDLRLAKEGGADLVFLPPVALMVPPGFQTTVEVKDLSRPLEGKFRPGHFRGVATVVSQLFHIVQPDVAYFGQKDAQQAAVIQRMVRDLHFDLKVRVSPTVREPDGLAMSSRNRLLSTSHRARAPILYEALQQGRRLIQSGCRRGSMVSRRIKRVIARVPGTRIEYAAVVDPSTFKEIHRIRREALLLVAAWMGGVRLIDGLKVTC